MKIGVLTSSRADYGIYLPLLRKLKQDDEVELYLVAFGMHLSELHGMTVENIEKDGFEVDTRIRCLLENDNPKGISASFGMTVLEFSQFWGETGRSLDLVFCLGDRFEMGAAVLAGVPFNIRFAHIHGGETTEGAIDNIYRDCITRASQLHFTSHPVHTQRVEALIGSEDQVFTVGALSLDNLWEVEPLEQQAFLDKYGIKDSPYILVTLHPETVEPQRNSSHIREFREAAGEFIEQLDCQLLISMPNADTLASSIRKGLVTLSKEYPSRVKLVENFGTRDYFSAMKHARFMMGNSSSGIIEAASFGNYVLDLGDRQKGRIHGDNVIRVPFDKDRIVQAAEDLFERGPFEGENPYDRGGAAEQIMNVLKSVS